MRVGLSTSVIQRGRTGLAPYVFGLTRALLELDHGLELTLFVLEEDRELFAFAEGRAHLQIVPERFRPAWRDVYWHQLCLPRLARRLELDVLHVPSHRRLLWRRPCALVATVHDLAAFRRSSNPDWKKRLTSRLLTGQFARRQDEIIAPSEHTAGDITRLLGRPASELQVIPHGLDHERFYPGDSSAAQRKVEAALGLDQPFILYLARLEHPRKNHLRLIEAFHRFKQRTGSPMQLVLTGHDGSGAESIHAAAAASPEASDIRFTGFIPDDLLPSLYRAASIVAYPSLDEDFGFPPLEAMACGVPVLTTDRGALPEVVARAAAHANPEDPGAIACGLERLHLDRLWRKSRIAAGLAHAARLNWQDCAAATHSIYQRAAERSRAAFPAPIATPVPWTS